MGMGYDRVRRKTYNAYLPGKIFGGFLAVAGLLCALAVLLAKTIAGILFGLLLLWASASVFVGNSRSENADCTVYAKFEQRTFDWYRKTYPASFRNERIFCRHCDSGRISTKSIYRGTYRREHECAQCGKTLYYSPERKD